MSNDLKQIASTLKLWTDLQPVHKASLRDLVYAVISMLVFIYMVLSFIVFTLLTPADLRVSDPLQFKLNTLIGIGFFVLPVVTYGCHWLLNKWLDSIGDDGDDK